ncbi:hypothetical protein [Roseicella frigidaeris]|uniref:Uncharacterized protein n=1 Tax=Roseicella frigidaeris TaxID=2230885 RepID=A0A327MDZ3_9PROT|nr:hypothetical protein [Roseicella frigidaeris]RAI58428.1 hypothetical protein DOO78_13840 [Roseicella frigidaeris]
MGGDATAAGQPAAQGVQAPSLPDEAALAAHLAHRRRRAFDAGLSAACYSQGVRLGLIGTALPPWLPTAPPWARQAMRAGHASGLAIAGEGEARPGR